MHLITRNALDIYHLTPSNILRIENSASPLHLERGGNITTTEMRTPQGCEALKLINYVLQQHTSHKFCHYLTIRTDANNTLADPHHTRSLFSHSISCSLNS